MRNIELTLYLPAGIKQWCYEKGRAALDFYEGETIYIFLLEFMTA